MKTKIMWSGAVITAFIVIGIWFYRQLRRVMGLVASALSIKGMDAFAV